MSALSPRVSPQSELLLALAARCEREEPSVALDAAIGRAIGNHNGAMWWTRKLDDAVTLVPDAAYGTKTGPMTCSVNQADDGSWWAELRDGWQTSYGAVFTAHAKTEPMARCAAALRARAALPKEEG